MVFKHRFTYELNEIFIKNILFYAKIYYINMVNTTHCDVCNHEYKYYKKHLQTNKHTFNLFRQISPLDQETKHCDRCDNDILYKNYL